MTDDQWIKTMVNKMTIKELLDEIMENPEYLVDSYYRDLGNALRNRYEELKELGK